jgi:hypothetical protein
MLNKKGDSICMSLLHCFLSTINYGLRMGGGMGEFLPPQTYAPINKQAYYIRLIYDLSFFLIVITILLNVIFGLIIDTFAQLRAEKEQNDAYMSNECFICGMKRPILERWTQENLIYHETYDHNPWNYLFFINHLRSIEISVQNGIESKIYHQITH